MWFKERFTSRPACFRDGTSRARAFAPTRAMVLLVALGLLAVLSVTLVLQLGTTQQVELSSIRLAEDGAARAVAEGCLAHANALVTHLPRPPPDPFFADEPPPPPDLSPLFTSNLGGVEVRFPPGGPRWGFFRRGDRSGCLVRIEDNSDDGDVPDAGVGSDSPTFDQDLAVVVTAIGLFPVLPDTPPDQAFARSHAHVTLRRLLSLQNRAFAAVEAGREVEMDNSARVCGAGGVEGPRLDIDGSACACGEITVGSVRGALPQAGCACVDDRNDDGSTAAPDFVACADTIRDGVPTAPDTGRIYPNTPGVLQGGRLSSFNDFAGAVTMPADRRSCTFFVDNDDMVYLWDHLDQTPQSQPAADAVVTCLPGASCATPAGRCDAYKQNPVERPCTWTLTGVPAAVCGAGQTPCWKPVQFLGSGPNDFAGALATWNTNRGFSGSPAIERVSTSDGPALAFRKNRPFFLAANRTRGRFGTSDAQCGGELAPTGPAPCQGCNGDDGVFAKETGSRFVLRKEANITHMPAPSIFIVDGIRDIVVDGAANPFTADTALPVSLITNGDITVKGRAALVRATVIADTPFREFEARIKLSPDPSSSRERCEQAIQFPSPVNDFATPVGIPVLSARRCTVDDVALLGGYMYCDRFSWRGKGCLAPAEIVSAGNNGRIELSPPEPGYVTGFVTLRAEDGDVDIDRFARVTDVSEVFGTDVRIGGDAVVRGFGTLVVAKSQVKLSQRALIVSDETLGSQEQAAATTEVTW